MTSVRSTHGWRSPDTPGVWIGLFVAALLVVQSGTPTRTEMACLIAIVATLLASFVWRIGPLAVLVLVVAGLILRVDAIGQQGSDVLRVTHAAIDQVLHGGNPYGHGFAESHPPGSPFAYGPLALLWYLPSLADPRRMELLTGGLILLALAVRGRVLGLAIYACLPILAITASDGSNDTSAGLLILVALLICERLPMVGAVALAVATAFKPYAFAWVVPLMAYGGWLTVVPYAVATLLLWGPAIVAWGAGSILDSFARADASQDRIYYSLVLALDDPFKLPKPLWGAFRVAAALALAAASWFLVRSARSFVVAGVAIFLAALYLGWWSTYAYFAALAPVLCWHLDDWLGLARVRLPGDPVERLTQRVDARWPIRRPWASADVSSPA